MSSHPSPSQKELWVEPQALLGGVLSMEHPVGSPHIHGQMEGASTASPVPFSGCRTLTRLKGSTF